MVLHHANYVVICLYLFFSLIVLFSMIRYGRSRLFFFFPLINISLFSSSRCTHVPDLVVLFFFIKIKSLITSKVSSSIYVLWRSCQVAFPFMCRLHVSINLNPIDPFMAYMIHVGHYLFDMRIWEPHRNNSHNFFAIKRLDNSKYFHGISATFTSTISKSNETFRICRV